MTIKMSPPLIRMAIYSNLFVSKLKGPIISNSKYTSTEFIQDKFGRKLQ